MKNLIILVLAFLFTTTFVNADDSIPQISETERIIDKYGGKIVEGFNNLVKTATPYAKEGFIIVVKLQYAKGIMCLLPLLGFIIFFYIFMREYNRISSVLRSVDVPRHMDNRYGPTDENNLTPLLVLSLIMSIILFLLSLVTTSSALEYLIAPEWFAIKEILNLIK